LINVPKASGSDSPQVGMHEMCPENRENLIKVK
jgi:hypothetical protein